MELWPLPLLPPWESQDGDLAKVWGQQLVSAPGSGLDLWGERV